MAVTIWWKDFNLIFFLIAIQILQVTVNLWSKRSGFSVCWDLSKECTKLRNYRYVTTFLSLVRTRRLLVTHELCVRISESVGLKTLWYMFICTHAVFRVSLYRVVYFVANTGFSVKKLREDWNEWAIVGPCEWTDDQLCITQVALVEFAATKTPFHAQQTISFIHNSSPTT